MRYLVTLTPLEPFLFGGDTTFGKLGDKSEGSYIVKSKQFPQQSAILGMLRKEIMIQAKLLTRKRRGEWVDKDDKKIKRAKELVGDKKFDIESKEKQDFGAIEKISPLFLLKDDKRFIKKVNIDNYKYEDNLLYKKNPKNEDDKFYTSKDESAMYDNFICIDDENNKLNSSGIFKTIEQVGNKKGGEENSFFKKHSYLLEEDFKFAFYLDCSYKLQNSIVTLGADRSSFKMKLTPSKDSLNYKNKNGYTTLLSDAYIPKPIECEFAITSEVSYRHIVKNHSHKFDKSKRVFMYERGSVFKCDISGLINNDNLQNIGYNITGEEK